MMGSRGMCRLPERKKEIVDEKEKVKGLRKDFERHIAKHDDIPGALRGIDGLKWADAILLTYKMAGILIGGLARELYQGNFSRKKLARRKDVDVIVFPNFNQKSFTDFFEGIDWWQMKQVDGEYEWENGFGIRLDVNPFRKYSQKSDGILSISDNGRIYLKYKNPRNNGGPMCYLDYGLNLLDAEQYFNLFVQRDINGYVEGKIKGLEKKSKKDLVLSFLLSSFSNEAGDFAKKQYFDRNIHVDEIIKEMEKYYLYMKAVKFDWIFFDEIKRK